MKPTAMSPMVFTVAATIVWMASISVRAAEGDDKIEPAFRQTYAYRTYLKGDTIWIGVTNGVVTLSGSVVDESHKALARSIAANLAGVARVDNLLTVESVTPVDSDAAIVRRVVLILRFNRDVSSARTLVASKGGMVTLTGEAYSPAQRSLITDYVSDVASVKEVRNEMVVASPLEPAAQTSGHETLDDASITAQIDTMLMTHASTSSIITHVTTRNGVVTLTGQAQNDAQHDLIFRRVSGVPGVTSVINQMTVKGEPRN